MQYLQFCIENCVLENCWHCYLPVPQFLIKTCRPHPPCNSDILHLSRNTTWTSFKDKVGIHNMRLIVSTIAYFYTKKGEKKKKGYKYLSYNLFMFWKTPTLYLIIFNLSAFFSISNRWLFSLKEKNSILKYLLQKSWEVLVLPLFFSLFILTLGKKDFNINDAKYREAD